jgi:hypothetical protein
MTHRNTLRTTVFRAVGVASLAVLGTVTLTHSVAAQQTRVVIAGSDQAANTITALLHISDDSIRSMIETHHPEALLNDGNAHHVLLVLDADGRYVRGSVTNATVVASTDEAGTGFRTFVVGDTAATVGSGTVVIRRHRTTRQAECSERASTRRRLQPLGSSASPPVS